MDTVSQAWTHYVDGSPSFVWEQKLKQTKNALKKWIKTPLPSPSTNRNERVAKLSALQFGMENNEITTSHIVLEQLDQLKTTQSFRQEEEHLRLKSRSL